MAENPFTAKAKKPNPFSSMATKQRSSSTTSRQRTSSQASAGKGSARLSRLFTLGYGAKKHAGKWVIVDRFGKIQQDEPTHQSPVAAQKRADEMNAEVQQWRQEELAKS